jgi:hypothetical protein
MKVPKVRQSGYGDRRETIRYVVDSNARTVRYILTSQPGAAAD